MRRALRSVPGLLWLALIWTILALWADDIRGIYIALLCAALSPAEMIRRQKAARSQPTDRDGWAGPP